MKILFIRENFDDEPLGLMYVSAVLKQLDCETDLLLLEYEDYINYIEDYKPDIIAYSLTSGYENYYLEININIKKKFPEIFSLFGGPHPTFFSEFINNESVNAIAIGEIENSLPDFVNNFYDKEKLYKTENFYFNDNGKIIKNEIKNLEQDLDSIPFPDRELVYKYKFAFNNKKKSFITGRGCPYKCNYCFNHIFHKIYSGKGKLIRKRSVDNVINEILEVKEKYPLKFLHFVDDIFIIDKDWLKEFSIKFPEKIGLMFTCNVRANLVTEEIAGLMRKSGCFSASVAIESGNYEVRKNSLNRDMTDETIINACKYLRKNNIRIATQNIVGIPGGSLKTDFDTVKINHKCKPDYAWCTIYQPYPGTKLAEIAKDLNLFNGDMKDMASSFHETSILNIKNKKEITNLHKLFGIACEFPKIFWLIKILIRLPFTKIYSVLRKIWNAYCYKYRLILGVTYKDIFARALKKIKRS